MMVFLGAVAAATAMTYGAARFLLGRLSGLRTTQSAIALSCLYFIAVFQLAKLLMGDGA